ncbi:hypothetical protein [Streptomyces zinciresistens]|nr:hypothetical protein [Streptomyces zinciresistens]
MADGVGSGGRPAEPRCTRRASDGRRAEVDGAGPVPVVEVRETRRGGAADRYDALSGRELIPRSPT